MKNVVLFGAGQTGRMFSRLINTENRILCFADNSKDKQGRSILGIQVLSIEESLKLKPEIICLCVIDKARADEMKEQLKQLGFSGSVIWAGAFDFIDPRNASMRLLAEQINEEDIPGDVAELGVYRGAFSGIINRAFPDRTIHLFDTFEGFPEKDAAADNQLGFSEAKLGCFSDTDIETVMSNITYPERAVFHIGFFPETFCECLNVKFAFVSIDADLYEPTKAALGLFWERLSPGGVLFIHDVNSGQYSGVKAALREFCREKKILEMPICDLHGSAVLRKGFINKV